MFVFLPSLPHRHAAHRHTRAASRNPRHAANLLCNKHVVKMVLESTQLRVVGVRVRA